MNVQAHSEPSMAAPVPMWRLWFALLAGPTAWATHDMAVSALGGWACADGDLALGSLSAGGVRGILILLTVIAIAFAAAGILIGLRSWRAVRNDSAGIEAWSDNVPAFMAVAGMLATALSLVGLVYATITLIVVDLCGKIQ